MSRPLPLPFCVLPHSLRAVAIPLSAIVLSSLPFKAIANTNPPDFSGTGQPMESTGRGSRGDRNDDCPNADMDIVPLLPIRENGGWTTTAVPKVWVYLPFGFSQHYDAKLIVNTLTIDEKGDVTRGDVIGREWLNIQPSQPGVHQFSLPLTEYPLPASPLPTNATRSSNILGTYSWTLEIFCNASSGELADPAIVRGTIRRVDADITSHANGQLSPPDSLSHTYADHHIWYDALTVLGEARVADPSNDDYKAAWQELLMYSTVGLEAIANQPLANCCAETVRSD